MDHGSDGARRPGFATIQQELTALLQNPSLGEMGWLDLLSIPQGLAAARARGRLRPSVARGPPLESTHSPQMRDKNDVRRQRKAASKSSCAHHGAAQSQ